MNVHSEVATFLHLYLDSILRPIGLIICNFIHKAKFQITSHLNKQAFSQNYQHFANVFQQCVIACFWKHFLDLKAFESKQNNCCKILILKQSVFRNCHFSSEFFAITTKTKQHQLIHQTCQHLVDLVDPGNLFLLLQVLKNQ